eukprot:2004652-Amphidinium_carterae.1
MDIVDEVLEVASGDVSQLVGRAGSTAQIVQERSGASVSVETQDAVSKVRLRGTKAGCEKAVRMLKAMLTFREAAQPEELGIC